MEKSTIEWKYYINEDPPYDGNFLIIRKVGTLVDVWDEGHVIFKQEVAHFTKDHGFPDDVSVLYFAELAYPSTFDADSHYMDKDENLQTPPSWAIGSILEDQWK